MAKLEKVIASMLNEITRAQAMSDAYSRQLTAAYREDKYLKTLPVPKTDVKEVKLDIKFSIKSVKQIYEAGLSKDYKKNGVDGLTVSHVEFGDVSGQVLGHYSRVSGKQWQRDSVLGEKEQLIYLIETRREATGLVLMADQAELGEGNFEYRAGATTTTINLQTKDIKIKVGEEIIERLKILRASSINPKDVSVVDYEDVAEMDIEVKSDELKTLPQNILSSVSITFDMESV